MRRLRLGMVVALACAAVSASSGRPDPALAARPGAAGRECRAVDRAALVETFADDFNRFTATEDGRDPRTGRAVWRTTYNFGKGPLRTLPSNKEAQQYTDAGEGPDPFRLAGGVLDINARPHRPDAGGRALPPGLNYTSGLITTQETFAQLYGFFEMRARLPSGRGFHTAFWLLPTDMTWPPEIDVVETLGHAPGTIYTNVHSTTGGNNLKPHAVGVDTSRGFHTYAVSWRPDEIRWYFDGCEIARTATPPDSRKPMFILACLAVGGPGSWPGTPEGAPSATWSIDYIRAHQFKDLAERRN